MLNHWHSGICQPVLGLWWRAGHKLLFGIMLSGHPPDAADMKHIWCTDMADCHTVLGPFSGVSRLCSPSRIEKIKATGLCKTHRDV